MTLSIQKLMEKSGVKFGTSGARGLVQDMSDRVCYAYTLGFIQYLEKKGDLHPQTSTAIAVAGDLRPSTPRIMNAVMRAISQRGYTPLNCGLIPSPAVALYGITHGIAAIMVTGSHIPADRNGIKFNKLSGEILKPDEEAIRAQEVEMDDELFDEEGRFVTPLAEKSFPVDQSAAQQYVERYLNFFKADALKGLRIGVYQHSAVGRDLLAKVVQALGAEVILLGRSETFIPVDTEAIRSEDIELGKKYTAQYRLDAIFSTDGDSDRPLLGDEKGDWFRGDVGGILCARYLGVHCISTPVSSNTAVEKCGWFQKVSRTRIGSPYVIGDMIENAQSLPGAVVAGYEANGGFLLQTPLHLGGKVLAALPTRDALIYLIAISLLALRQGKTLSQLAAELPQCYTYSDRLQNFPTETSRAILKHFSSPDCLKKAQKAWGSFAGTALSVDNTDGVRFTFNSQEIIHLRPSGNAPEFRCYTEAATPQRATELNGQVMNWLRKWI